MMLGRVDGYTLMGRITVAHSLLEDLLPRVSAHITLYSYE
jgi:hypothetical protein